jgi:hypothetical protein
VIVQLGGSLWQKENILRSSSDLPSTDVKLQLQFQFSISMSVLLGTSVGGRTCDELNALHVSRTPSSARAHKRTGKVGKVAHGDTATDRTQPLGRWKFSRSSGGE